VRQLAAVVKGILMMHIDPTRHSGSVAIVTGAGSGIGQATALRLALEGASVIGCDANADGLEGTRSSIEAQGKAAELVRADITDQDDIERLVGQVLDRHGRVDILANVAGIMDWFLPAHEVDDTTWNRVLDVNVTGVMRLSRRVLPQMMQQQSGAIVNVASVGGFRGGAAGIAYTTSKHAVIGLTRSIAWTYQTEGIRCNAVCPGGVATNIGTTAVPRSEWGMQRLQKIHALSERLAASDEIATLLSWLCSEEASNVNGAVISADGGWTAG
jgi:NAD(P)-dependent dehydrogenase (short-subunit alcohol dehydrogenase family)